MKADQVTGLSLTRSPSASCGGSPEQACGRTAWFRATRKPEPSGLATAYSEKSVKQVSRDRSAQEIYNTYAA